MILSLMAVTFLISAWLTQYFARPQSILYIVDEPNTRSLHHEPVPVSGGIAILIAFTFAIMVIFWRYQPSFSYFWLGLGGMMVALISFWDDFCQVSIWARLLVHSLAAFVFLWQGDFWLSQLSLPNFVLPLPPLLDFTLSFLFIVWMINLYNFMDGMDGFAGGMAVFGFGSLGILGGLAGHQLFMVINLTLASAVGGFLVFNFPPARIFMGDTGSSSLGFLAAAFSLWGHREDIFPLWLALLLFSPFIVDATVTLLRRLVQGEKIWQAHKSHYYQRLVQLGWGHKRTVLWEYGLMICCGLSVFITLYLPSLAQWGLFIGWGGIYIFLIYLVNWLEQN
jgi:UDP-N-acetylmuramyl pentapeptide phosphotransferase/UDP-N-acetylglucosamine-1-phosphate transferase